ncbi:MAG TPA: 30S ribosomal protein S20 [Kofleriaceae bacterium]|nr:30S ribosomal protein S20 [Kofleriaceae bacterium]
MPNHKSAEKRDRQKQKRRIRNRITLGGMRSALKNARTAVAAKSPEAPSLLKQAVALVDRAVTKGSLPRRTASRYISRLTRAANQ